MHPDMACTPTALPHSRSATAWRLAAAAMALTVLGGCAAPPPVYAPAPPPAVPVAAAAPQALYFYPQRQQGERQQDRDRYECYQWAVHQTGTNPGMTPLRTYSYAPAPVYYDSAPGRDTFGGAVTGAAIGAIAASPHNSGAGAAAGLVLGALIGAISDQNRAVAVQRANDYQAQAYQTYTSRNPPSRGRFQRAMSACMTGRGYAVG
jgi:hypothetical protein